MRRYAFALPVPAAALFVCVGAGAQKKTKPDAKAEPAPLKSDATLDETLVRGETPLKWGGVVIFEAGDGKKVVSYRGRDGKLGQYADGEFRVDKKSSVEPIAVRRAAPSRSAISEVRPALNGR